jgi:TRAP transporter TAXI family solute receptor
MNYLKLLLGTAAGVALATTASAQTVGIGSTKAGAVAQITATISKAVSEHGGLQMRTQTMGGTQQYIPVVNAGELEFGISNITQFHFARTGTGLSKGTPYENLQLVATMMKFTVSPVVALKSGITTTAQLKGTRMAVGFKGAPLFANIHQGALATADLVSPKDIKPVPQVGLVQHWRAFMAGKIDWVIAAAGSGFVKQMNAKIDGGIRHISFPNTPEALAKMHKFFPKTTWEVIPPRKGLTGVVEPTNFVSYDYMLWTHKALSNEMVYKVTKVMHTQEKQLKEGGPLWRSYQANERLAKPQGHPYHPGAMKYYKEAGIWPAGS